MTEYKNFRISIGDDSEHEDLTAEIYYRELFIALISQERGFDKLKIDIFQKPNGDTWSFLLADFMKVIELSKKRLWELRKIEVNSDK